MKKAIVLCILTIVLGDGIKAQPISNDTVVCIIDTAKSFVHYRAFPYGKRDTSCVWQVSVDGHYYDISLPRHKDFASIVFNANDLSNVHGQNFKGPFMLKMPKNELKTRFTFVIDEWVNQQTNFHTLREKIGFFPRDKYNFIVFKHEYDNSKNDSVTMYRVALGYSEVEE